MLFTPDLVKVMMYLSAESKDLLSEYPYII